MVQAAISQVMLMGGGGEKEAIFICKYQCKVPDEWPDLVVKLCLTKCKIMSVFVFPVFFIRHTIMQVTRKSLPTVHHC